jgi:hypothetical protein
MPEGAPKTVVCGDCEYSFEISARREYDWRRKGRQPVCEPCRRPPKPVTEEDRQWWLERFSLDEIRQIAVALWP